MIVRKVVVRWLHFLFTGVSEYVLVVMLSLCLDIAGGSPRSKGPSPDKLGGDEGHKSGAGASEAANNVYSSFLSKVNAIVDGSTDHTKYVIDVFSPQRALFLWCIDSIFLHVLIKWVHIYMY